MAKKHRGGRSRKDFARDRAKREPQIRILIVTEGSKTEPSYFLNLARELKLKSVCVHPPQRLCTNQCGQRSETGIGKRRIL